MQKNGLHRPHIIIIVIVMCLVCIFKYLDMRWLWRIDLSSESVQSQHAISAQNTYQTSTEPQSQNTASTYLSAIVSTTSPMIPCSDVLKKMVQGRWSYRNYTIQELDEVETIVRRQRSFHKIPDVLQRRDGRCGNVNYEGLEWFRALCNPKGSTPCCYNNTCVNRTVNECQCEGCFDFRAKKYAELAEWIPDDHSCKIRKFQSEDEVCRVLGNTTIYFIGDSFMRQLYISVLGFFEDEDSKNIFVDNTSPAIIQKCDKHYRYIAECRHSLKHDFSECNARIHCEEMFFVTEVGQVLNAMKTLTGKNNSWFLVGFGAHDSYNPDLVQKTLIEPLLLEAAKSTWPKFVWYEPQAAGHLKTQRVPEQLNPRRKTFNAKINALMEKHNVPIIKFYNMTSQVLSYDGSHYGKGVNDVKAHILLNYILEERSRLRSR